MAMELLIIILDPYMMHHFNANELLHAFIFHICDFNNAASVSRIKKVKGHRMITYW